MKKMEGRASKILVVVVLAIAGWTCGLGGQAAWAGVFQWTWIRGASTRYQSGTYGTIGIPAAANTPGARSGAVSWTDGSGALYLFGGGGEDGAGASGHFNDLWKYDPSSGNWTWMKGASTRDQFGTYGTRGTPASGNTPSARSGAVSWTDGPGALYLFGGWGCVATPEYGDLNDLWKYDPSTGNWTWIKGASTVNQWGIYGTRGTPAADNTPGARGGAVSWTGGSGALYLFGGAGWDGAGVSGHFNDLWKYDPSTGNWTWMKGASTVDQPGTYGTLGTPAADNTPGARYSAVSWTDGSGALYLFGGYGCDGEGAVGYLNDLWKYDPSTGNWTWIKGASTRYQSGTYGMIGIPAADNTPGARSDAVSWTDGSGALYLFGGGGCDGAGDGGFLNDLWRGQVPTVQTAAKDWALYE